MSFEALFNSIIEFPFAYSNNQVSKTYKLHQLWKWSFDIKDTISNCFEICLYVHPKLNLQIYDWIDLCLNNLAEPTSTPILKHCSQARNTHTSLEKQERTINCKHETFFKQYSPLCIYFWINKHSTYYHFCHSTNYHFCHSRGYNKLFYNKQLLIH